MKQCGTCYNIVCKCRDCVSCGNVIPYNCRDHFYEGLFEWGHTEHFIMIENYLQGKGEMGYPNSDCYYKALREEMTDEMFMEDGCGNRREGST